MKPEVYIKDLEKFVDREVTIYGWIYNIRSSGKVRFLLVRDGTGIVQCVATPQSISPGKFEGSDKIPQESSIIVRGKVRKDSRAPYCGYEIELTDYNVVSYVEREYPIALKEHGIDFLMNHRHLWIRSYQQSIILRIRATIVKSIRDFFDSNGFILVDAPIFTPNACEGTSTLFETNYFDTKAYLTQSGQLYMEAAAMALGKVYCFGPTFRAEKSKTRRHLTEFWMVEPEMAYYDLEDDMEVAEGLVSYIIETVLLKHENELIVLGRNVDNLRKASKRPFYRIKYAEAVELLRKAGHDIKYGDDFGGDEETTLTKQFDKPVFVTHYPIEIKAFYMKRDPNDPSLALNMDLLAPEGYGEIIGGGQREDNLQILLESIKKHNLPQNVFEWYLDLRRYGSVPHSGFGLGVERTIAYICGLHHVRETIPFPRLMDRLNP
ncbi:MAG: asparagine--tRNA ligase [Deltaproteobacteria bacterium]|nr:asparagine--tRNA ligase [Deltaproteobacteria bacterium]